VLHHLAALLAPPLCGVCGEPCGARRAVCKGCERAIAAAPPCPLLIPGVDRGWAAARYDGASRRLVAALKFGHRLALARVAACAIAARAPDDESLGVLVPVPADPVRNRLRGFDPAATIGVELAAALELDLTTCLLRRHGPRQVGRSRNDRLGAGLMVALTESPPRIALLVDDVTTTGATLAACAAALRQAGSERVLAATFARA
jgi:predicted amidophosphoribosyltransferase